jgi:predicted dehydrogenase
MKVRVIGTGFGARVFAPVYQDLGMQVELVSARDADGARRACTAPADFVSIHSPPFLHHEHVMLALESGQNVLCDKPFGRSALEAQAMLDAAREAGVIHLINFEFRHDAARQRLKGWIDEGAIGQVRHIGWTLYSNGSRGRKYGWLFDREAGGGWIGAYGAHVLDAMRWMIGEIVDSRCVCRTDIPTRTAANGDQIHCTAEDAFTSFLVFDNGATGMIDTGFGFPEYRPQRIEVLGSEGVIVLNGVTDLQLRVGGEERERLRFEAPAGDPHEPSFRAWAAAVKQAVADGNQIRPSFEDGLASALLMDRLRDGAVWPASAPDGRRL